MSLSKYLARDKSTIDVSIDSRDPIAGPAIATASDALLIYDASEGITKKSPVSDIVNAGVSSEFSPGVTALFRSLPTGWSAEPSATNGYAIRIVDNGTNITNYSGGGPIANIMTNVTMTGNVSFGTAPLSIDPHSLTTPEMPEHTHTSGARLSPSGARTGAPYTSPPGGSFDVVTASNSSTQSWYITPAGSGTAHAHTISPATHDHNATFSGNALNFDVKYADFALATKD